MRIYRILSRFMLLKSYIYLGSFLGTFCYSLWCWSLKALLRVPWQCSPKDLRHGFLDYIVFFLAYISLARVGQVSRSSRYNICDHKLLPPMTDDRAVSLRDTVLFTENTKRLPHSSSTDQTKASGDRKCTRVCTARGCRPRTMKTNVLQPEWASKNHNAPQTDVARSSEIPSQHLRRPDPHLFCTLIYTQSSSAEVLARRLIGTCA